MRRDGFSRATAAGRSRCARSTQAAGTIDSFEKRFSAAVSGDADDWLWERTDPLSRTTLLQRGETVLTAIQGLLPGATTTAQRAAAADSRPNNPVNMAVTKP